MLFACPTAPDSWISRVLKKKKKKPKSDSSSSSSSGRKSKTTDPYEGINDFSEVAAVFDYYEVCYTYNTYICTYVRSNTHACCCRRNGIALATGRGYHSWWRRLSFFFLVRQVSLSPLMYRATCAFSFMVLQHCLGECFRQLTPRVTPREYSSRDARVKAHHCVRLPGQGFHRRRCICCCRRC